MTKFKFLLLLLALGLFVATPAFADRDKNCHVVSEALDPTEAQGTHDYLNLTDGTFGTSRTADDEFTIPVNMVASNLRVVTTTAPGAGDIWTVSLFDDATETPVLCSISGTATTCSNLASKAAIAAGSKLVALVISANGASDPTATSEILISFCLSES